jgi:hypothetical protein
VDAGGVGDGGVDAFCEKPYEKNKSSAADNNAIKDFLIWIK